LPDHDYCAVGKNFLLGHFFAQPQLLPMPPRARPAIKPSAARCPQVGDKVFAKFRSYGRYLGKIGKIDTKQQHERFYLAVFNEGDEVYRSITMQFTLNTQIWYTIPFKLSYAGGNTRASADQQ
jgi:hypothetical protein